MAKGLNFTDFFGLLIKICRQNPRAPESRMQELCGFCHGGSALSTFLCGTVPHGHHLGPPLGKTLFCHSPAGPRWPPAPPGRPSLLLGNLAVSQPQLTGRPRPTMVGKQPLLPGDSKRREESSCHSPKPTSSWWESIVCTYMCIYTQYICTILGFFCIFLTKIYQFMCK